MIVSPFSFPNKLLHGDALEILKTLDSESVDCIVTSPPYWALRDYGAPGQLGIESDFRDYIDKLCTVFDELRRVLKRTGTCWLNLGDTYNGYRKHCSLAGINPAFNRLRPSRSGTQMPTKKTSRGLPSKCLMQIPSRVAIALCARGWILRNEIIWHKPNCMPSSVTDRFTMDYEKIFFLTKSTRYYFNQRAVLEPLAPSSMARLSTNVAGQRGSYRAHGGRTHPMKAVATEGNKRNKRCVWTVAPASFRGPHFATFPQKLIEIPILAGCPEGGVVLDPFCGSGTTGIVAKQLSRIFVGIDLNASYLELARRRIEGRAQ